MESKIVKVDGNLVESAGMVEINGTLVDASHLADIVYQGIKFMEQEVNDNRTGTGRREYLLYQIRYALFCHQLLLGDEEEKARSYAANEIVTFCNESINGLKK